MNNPMRAATGEPGDADRRVEALERKIAALYRRLTDRAESLPNLLPKFYRREEIPAFGGGNEAPVDLVLTVRNTYDFLVPCLESVFRNTDVPFRLFLNDNASDDARTIDYLKMIRDRHPEQVTLFLQKENLGFPDAVNVMLGETTRDVILINADIVVPPNWASRLLWTIRHSGEKAASSAPFSTAAAMGGFPYARIDNELLPEMDADRTDRVFHAVKPTTQWPLLFSPGFCMALSRDALDAVGLLDAETFRPGYGEESDWCCRASKAGYKHFLTANLFVYHKHGVTFKRQSSTERDALLENHLGILNRRYPGFGDKLHEFNDNPEFLALCSFLLFLAGCESAGGLSVRFVSPDSLRTRRDDSPEAVLLVARDAETGEYFLRFTYREHRAAFTSPNLNWVIKMLYRVRVKAIRVEALPPGDEARTRHAVSRMGAYFDIAPRGKDGNEIHEA